MLRPWPLRWKLLVEQCLSWFGGRAQCDRGEAQPLGGSSTENGASSGRGQVLVCSGRTQRLGNPEQVSGQGPPRAGVGWAGSLGAGTAPQAGQHRRVGSVQCLPTWLLGGSQAEAIQPRGGSHLAPPSCWGWGLCGVVISIPATSSRVPAPSPSVGLSVPAPSPNVGLSGLWGGGCWLPSLISVPSSPLQAQEAVVGWTDLIQD